MNIPLMIRPAQQVCWQQNSQQGRNHSIAKRKTTGTQNITQAHHLRRSSFIPDIHHKHGRPHLNSMPLIVPYGSRTPTHADTQRTLVQQHPQYHEPTPYGFRNIRSTRKLMEKPFRRIYPGSISSPQPLEPVQHVSRTQQPGPAAAAEVAGTKGHINGFLRDQIPKL